MIKYGKYTLIKDESVSKAGFPKDFAKYGSYDLLRID
jgi:hypothetical protein